ncbi:MAG: hypothetical protein A2992_00345 [Elusimicrobia bacterium RIFCSPLOWO2_01_FULL_59_12]|nr:MAG: hypothetical protein A2992_00345 [Elusimicrobia bacterium RIFCSPLOWO2_01_FULL_59_12]
MNKKWILGAGTVVLGLPLALWIWPGHHAPQPFVVPKGAAASEVARDLRDAKLIGSRRLFLAWVKIQRDPGSIRPGVYQLAPGWTGFHIARQLRRGPPLVRVTFPEGWMAKQMAELLEARGIASVAGFMDIVKKEKREGYLFPDTYFFNQGLEARQVVNRMIDRFHEQAPKDMAVQAKALKLSYGHIVTLASLVEKEARVPQERAVIAGVFYNRLRKRWRLESCASVEYALGKWKRKLSYKDLAVDSPYNTYLHFGLPPGPICNPGQAALEAAAHPAATDMMFFIAEGDGTHRFSRYYKEHLEGKRQRKNHD